jgi:hypothetical protein
MRGVKNLWRSSHRRWKNIITVNVVQNSTPVKVLVWVVTILYLHLMMVW